ncbi:hypothetical protein [Fibrisoma limi]|uniref:hypothetical protein n=1 Tax=Fibrisoma limi TaxID=663275 RepID=UPI000586F75F|nr:hypothetical protein [Fibrisoma limi]
MDTNAENGLLTKYGRKPYPPLGKPDAGKIPETEDDDEETGYHALIEQREKKGSAPRFRIVLAGGQSHGCGYAYLLGWLHTPPDTFTIYTTTHIFILSGKNLHRIENALMRDKVKQLREYNPKTDTMPADGEPFIEHINVTSRFEQ